MSALNAAAPLVREIPKVSIVFTFFTSLNWRNLTENSVFNVISCSENFSDTEESTAETGNLERLNQEQILDQTEGIDKEQVL